MEQLPPSHVGCSYCDPGAHSQQPAIQRSHPPAGTSDGSDGSDGRGDVLSVMLEMIALMRHEETLRLQAVMAYAVTPCTCHAMCCTVVPQREENEALAGNNRCIIIIIIIALFVMSLEW